MHLPRTLIVRLPVVAIALLTTVVAAATTPAPSGSGPSHRTEFLAAGLALAAGQSAEFQRRRQALDGYVLAPYLDYATLRKDLRTLDDARARTFLNAESSTQLGHQFRQEWQTELARREEWTRFLAFDTGATDVGTTLRCQRLRARIATGGDSDAIRDELLALWPTGASLPNACDDAIAYGRGRGWIDGDQVMARLRLALADSNAGLATHLIGQLPAGERADGERLAKALSDPEGTLVAARTWPDQPIHREAAHWALQRRARQEVASAIGHWQVLSGRFAFDQAQRGAVLRAIALYAAVAYRADAEDWFEQVPATNRDEQLMEWQLRAALVGGDWKAVRDVANGLPPELVDTPRPRYWRARALRELGQGDAADAAFRALALEANFHGFMAADQVQAPYAVCPLEVTPDPHRALVLRAETDIARALELQSVGWRAEATRAWDFAMRNAPKEHLLQALVIAAQQGWYDRALMTLNRGEDMRYYALRFPAGEREVVEREAAANSLDPAWVFALIRAESAFQSDARSHADAYGLMQLLPGTGRQMARELGITWNGTSTLLDAHTNIRLGTRYLSQQANRFGSSPWLASAAYNAGPAPVQRWLSARPTLPADVFIETIPYKETREYVARVLAFSVIYDWRLYGKARPLASRLPDPGQRYAGVPSLDSARAVTCPSRNEPGTAP